MTAAATASAKTRKRPDRRAVREGGATGGGEPLKVRGATMADGRIKSPLGTSRTRRPTAMGNMGSRVEPGCPPPHALAGSTLAAPATSCSRTPRADARTPRGLAGSWRGSSAKARRFARKGSTRQRRKSGSKCSRCGHGRRTGGGWERDACARALRTANRLCIRAGTVRARGLVLPLTRPVTLRRPCSPHPPARAGRSTRPTHGPCCITP